MDGNTDVTAVRQEPYNMPGGFEWDSLDVTDPDGKSISTDVCICEQ
jgi:hypothetical protein